MIVAVPEPIPLTVPLADPTVTTAVLLLVHVPPPASLSVILEPVQIALLPLIVPAVDITVIDLATPQPVLFKL